MTLLPRPSAAQPRPVSLTGLLQIADTRSAWSLALPHTTRVVREVNSSSPGQLCVAPSAWTEELHQYGIVGTAYDYAVGTLWARHELDSVFDRVDAVTPRFSALRKIVAQLRTLLHDELVNVRGGLHRARQRDFFRGLGLLAQLDAMFRAPVEPPLWTLRLRARRVTRLVLRERLRRHFPDAFVDELRGLLEATHADLPKHARIVYNPVFGGAPGLEHVCADGDVIVGDMLVDLKASKRSFGRYHLWQLLGYAALDRLHGRLRIARIGLYNPRFRHLWCEDIDTLTARLGAGSLDAFTDWFRGTPEAHGFASARAA